MFVCLICSTRVVFMYTSLLVQRRKVSRVHIKGRFIGICILIIFHIHNGEHKFISGVVPWFFGFVWLILIYFFFCSP